MAAPTVSDVAEYLELSAEDDRLTSAFNAEKAAQAAKCRVPADDAEWPKDLVEALCRRVSHNLALRGLPLGVSAVMSDAFVQTSRVGGEDAEVRRLEGPYRRWVVG